jgi:hypothetical protein
VDGTVSGWHIVHNTDNENIINRNNEPFSGYVLWGNFGRKGHTRRELHKKHARSA